MAIECYPDFDASYKNASTYEEDNPISVSLL